ncbi:MAG: flagellar motor switch protein FliM [Peptococcaceae bacterium]|jgi:flagellar motor switch protein FliM|nr:flagellar motor switch protein FliM [Peptococcaceae bacterium]
MADVLSQNEIDALLNALSDGQVDAENIKTNKQQRVRVYDFKRPNKFSKDQIRSLHNIHENFCRQLTTYFTAHLNTAVDVKVSSIEQLTYDEFIRSLPNPTILGVFQFTPLEGNLLLEMSPSIAFAVIERLLGGSGQTAERNRALTEIERLIIEQRLKHIIRLNAEAWSEVSTLDSHLVTMETNPQFTQIIAPNEMIVLATIEIAIGDAVGMLNICFPYLTIEPILGKLSTLFLFSTQTKERSPEEQAQLRHNIEHAAIDLSICLGNAQITVRDLLELTPGDIIPLNQLVQQPLPVSVGSFVKFQGLPGLFRGHVAVKLTEVIPERKGLG